MTNYSYIKIDSTTPITERSKPEGFSWLFLDEIETWAH